MDIIAIIVDGLRSAIGVNGAIFALAAVGLNLHFGFTGLLNFGHVAFLLVGAYSVAITVEETGPGGALNGLLGGLPPILVIVIGVVLGMLVAAILALIIGIPTLRLRTDYLAIVTIAIAEIVRLLVRSSALAPVTRGVFGIQKFADGFYDFWETWTVKLNVDGFFEGGLNVLGRSLFTERALYVIITTWTLVALTSWLIWALTRSPWGRVLKSIREDEDAARSLGKNVFAYKMQSLVLGGMIGSLAGVMRALDQQNVNPDSFVPLLTFFFYALLILGGAGTILGPIVGSIIFWFIIQGSQTLLTELVQNVGFLPDGLASSSNLAAIRFIMVGLFLLTLMAFRPQGIFGSKEEMLLESR